MKKNGYTLVELLAILILLGIIMALAIPNALKLGSKVKKKSYDAKIELIEKAAESYGASNLELVRQGKSPIDGKNYTCTFSYLSDDISSVDFLEQTKYDANKAMVNEENKKEYWCFKMTIEDLVNAHSLDWDYTNKCEGNCTDDNKDAYDNIVINPSSKYVINKCYLYIYYKNKRAYAYYDKSTCNIQTDIPTDGHEYRQI